MKQSAKSMQTLGSFVLMSLNFSDFSKYFQILKFRQSLNKSVANLLYT